MSVLIFKKLSYKNFLSTGNSPTILNLNDSSLTVVTGINGAGKSTIISAIYFALYGKPFANINKISLVNSINEKNCLVELELEYNKINYSIKRGIKPNVFEIYENDKLVPQNSNIKAYQEWLNTNVLKMDEKTFRQIVVMGSTSFIPFMRLSALDRRKIIENLLCIEFFSEMNSIAKERYQELNNKQTDVSFRLKEIDYKIKTSIKTSETLVDNIKEQIKSLEEQKNGIANDIAEEISNCEYLDKEKNKSSYDDLKENIIQLKQKMNDNSNETQILKHKLYDIKNKLLFFEENKSCPYCSQSITDELIKNKRNDYLPEINQYISQIDNINAINKELYIKYEYESSKLKEKEESFQNIENLYNISYNKLKELKGKFQVIKNELEKSNITLEELKNTKSEEHETLQEELNDVQKELDDLNEKIDSYKNILSLLKDDGIKSVIIKNYLNTINLFLKKYIDAFGFNVSFTFDENFVETIKSRNRDIFEYGAFSEGERLRLDLSLLFTFRELCKIRASVHTNLLIIDELDGKADSDCQYSINSLLKSLDCNVFVITQYPQMYESITDRLIIFNKSGHFSRIE